MDRSVSLVRVRRGVLVGALAVSTTLAVGGVLPATAAALPSGCSGPGTAGTTVTCTYGPGSYTFTPPAGVSSVTLSVSGGSGGSGGTSYTKGPVAAGGAAAMVTGSALVTANGLQIVVGARGSDAPAARGSSLSVGGAGGDGGPGRGGKGGDTALGLHGGGGGGGGASSVSASGAPLAVAGGGGGGGGSVAGVFVGNARAGGAGGASSSAGGQSEDGVGGGQPGAAGGPDGVSGTSTAGSSGSGGGGGGVAGGGAGQVGFNSASGGGGGGTSLVPANGAVSNAGSTGDGSVVITYTQPAPTAGAITATSGGGQSAQAGKPFARPLVATVTDPNQADAPVPGAVVTFAVTSGTARFPNGQTTTTATTTENGQASTPLTAGPTAGGVTIQATTPGAPGAATFTETVTAAPVTPSGVRVSGAAQFRANGQTVNLTLDATSANATTGTPASGRCGVSGGGYVAQCVSITSVTRGSGTSANTATVTGTAQVPGQRQPVAFRAVVGDNANPNGAGRDTVTLTVNGRTATGTVSNGNLTITNTTTG